MQQPADVDFCSITIDGSLDNDILQQRLHTVLKQREELQQIETELRAQLIARSEIMGLQSSYDSQIKEHINANVNLQVCFLNFTNLVIHMELRFICLNFDITGL